MQRIIIKNFGSISSAEIELKKIIILIGENAVGKSTIIKLISTFLWIEKSVFRGSDIKWLEKENRFKNTFLSYHRIENYLKTDTVIEYYGEANIIKYSQNKITISKRDVHDYQLPQLMYVPAERNFLTYLRSTKDLKSEGALQDFEREYFNATNNLKGSLSLPISSLEIEYNKRHEMLYVKNKNYKIKITEAASGLQSLIPLYIVTEYLAKLVENKDNIPMSSGDIRIFEDEISSIITNNNLSEKQKQIAISTLSNKFNKKAFVNIVEEPEQNLFPVTQMNLIKHLVSICNLKEDNKLIISTHSPYVLATINNMILAKKASGNSFKDVETKVNKQFWLNFENVYAGFVKDGIVEQIIDQEFEMIPIEQIDSVSKLINEEFDFLYNILTEKDHV